MRRALLALAISALVVSTAGCRKGGDADKSRPAQKQETPTAGPGAEGWPAKPADGAPVAVEFVSLAKAGDDLRARMRLSNFGEKDVRGVHLELEYLAEDGKVLKAMPWSQVAPTLVGARAQAEHEMGAFLPPDTKTVRAVIHRVELSDGTDWRPAGP